LGELDLRPTLRVDVDGVALADLTADLLAAVQKFEPCGFGNPAPVLASRRLRVKDWRTVGAEGKHLKLTLADERQTQDAIAFGQAQQWVASPAALVDIAYDVEWNEWKGERRLQLNVKSIQASAG
jgi:single-stranded-DNA-specific exonuclease